MRKPFDFKKKSNKNCIDCGKPLKANLIAKNPGAIRCYKDHELYKKGIKKAN